MKSRIGQVWDIEGTFLLIIGKHRRRMSGQACTHPCLLLETGEVSEVYEWTSSPWNDKTMMMTERTFRRLRQSHQSFRRWS